MSREIVIQASDLTKFYGEILAVDHINFEVEKGEIFGFLGPNGAGARFLDFSVRMGQGRPQL